jgi:hypothetical protein
MAFRKGSLIFSLTPGLSKKSRASTAPEQVSVFPLLVSGSPKIHLNSTAAPSHGRDLLVHELHRKLKEVEQRV